MKLNKADDLIYDIKLDEDDEGPNFEIPKSMQGFLISAALKVNFLRLIFKEKTLYWIVAGCWLIYIGLGYLCYVKEWWTALVICIIMPVINTWFILRK